MQKLKQQEETAEEELTGEELNLVFTNLVQAGSPPSVDVSVLLHSVQVCAQ